VSFKHQWAGLNGFIAHLSLRGVLFFGGTMDKDRIAGSAKEINGAVK